MVFVKRFRPLLLRYGLRQQSPQSRISEVGTRRSSHPRRAEAQSGIQLANFVLI